MDLLTDMFKRAFQMMLLGLALSVPVQVFGASSYGPVSRQETLWSIASRLRPSTQVTVQQTMLALYHKNPQAFAGNNINSLLKGARLQVPHLTEIRRYTRIAALREAHRQNTYWKRGIELPKSSPPPLPAVARKTAPVQKNRRTTPVAPAVDQRLQQEVANLKQQLNSEQAKSRQLSAALKALQAQAVQVSKAQAATPVVAASAATVAKQVSQLKDELASLKTVLEQKDNHIKTLQSSLKSASEAIKSQHADNMRLYDKLKEVSPASLPTTPASDGKPVLKLADVNDGAKADAATESTASAAIDQATEGKVWADDVAQKATDTAATNPDPESDATADTAVMGTSPVFAGGQKRGDMAAANAVAAPKSIPLSTILNNNSAETLPSSAAPEDGNSRTGVSPLALVIALISLLFILALAWRAYLQQRALRRIEAEETARAEKMRQRLAENTANSINREKAQAVPQTELNF